MKNKIARSIIIFVLICVTVITLMSLCACQKDDDTQPSGDQSQNVNIPNYDALNTYGVKRMYVMDITGFWEGSHAIELVTSEADWEKYDILGPVSSDVDFDNNVILLIQFRYESADRNIEFKNLAIKDGKFYPIFATNSPIPPDQATSNGFKYYKIYVIKVSKNVLEYEAGNILIINRDDIAVGSTYYKSITSVFK